MAGEQVIDEIADDGIGLVAELRHDATNQDPGPTVPFKVDHAMRFLAMNLGPAMRTAGAKVLGRDEIEFLLELGIAHDLVPQRAAARGDDLDYGLHSLGENRPQSDLWQLPPGCSATAATAPETSRRRQPILSGHDETPRAGCRQC